MTSYNHNYAYICVVYPTSLYTQWMFTSLVISTHDNLPLSSILELWWVWCLCGNLLPTTTTIIFYISNNKNPSIHFGIYPRLQLNHNLELTNVHGIILGTIPAHQWILSVMPQEIAEMKLNQKQKNHLLLMMFIKSDNSKPPVLCCCYFFVFKYIILFYFL